MAAAARLGRPRSAFSLGLELQGSLIGFSEQDVATGTATERLFDQPPKQAQGVLQAMLRREKIEIVELERTRASE